MLIKSLLMEEYFAFFEEEEREVKGQDDTEHQIVMLKKFRESFLFLARAASPISLHPAHQLASSQ